METKNQKTVLKNIRIKKYISKLKTGIKESLKRFHKSRNSLKELEIQVHAAEHETIEDLKRLHQLLGQKSVEQQICDWCIIEIIYKCYTILEHDSSDDEARAWVNFIWEFVEDE